MRSSWLWNWHQGRCGMASRSWVFASCIHARPGSQNPPYSLTLRSFDFPRSQEKSLSKFSVMLPSANRLGGGILGSMKTAQALAGWVDLLDATRKDSGAFYRE